MMKKQKLKWDSDWDFELDWNQKNLRFEIKSNWVFWKCSFDSDLDIESLPLANYNYSKKFDTKKMRNKTKYEKQREKSKYTVYTEWCEWWYKWWQKMHGLKFKTIYYLEKWDMRKLFECICIYECQHKCFANTIYCKFKH